MITDIDIEIPLKVCRDLCGRGIRMKKLFIFHNGSYLLRFSLPMAFFRTRGCLNYAYYKTSYCEIFSTLVDRGVCVLLAIFRLTSGRDPSTIDFNTFELKVSPNDKLLERVTQVSLIREVLPKSELTLPSSLVGNCLPS